MEVVNDFGDPFFKVLFEEVLEFAGEFDACGTAAYNDHVEEAFALFVGLVFERGGFHAIHDSFANLLRIADFF